ncbi:hypothetical protein [Methylobacterium segetis]|uniref:hypothetical protein n=1 Tax=Methylobacterium segetis TaxID=2488750 RepID=UPI00104A29FA|nr:hypothetical protein [Methylobacterium segetis]
MDPRKPFGTEDPPALTHLFEPPDDHVGVFGWLCGYSADAHFLNAAAERFTRRTKRRRAADGVVSLALVLDPGTPRLSPLDVPGVLHLPLPAARPFALLHAKVALLGFRHLQDSARWRLRLVVATGNWTRETLEESLDLAWTVEVEADALAEADAEQRLADLAAASNFLGSLRARLGASPLDAASPLTREAVRALDAWCAAVTSRVPAGLVPRFIDTRSAPLLSQIVARIAPGERNYLAMGSGFYEGGEGADVPRVPAAVVAALLQDDLLMPGAEIDLFVNPDGCQAVAGALPAIAWAGWTVRRPGQGPLRGRPRGLHAKFLLGAHYDARSPRCRRAWLYLGSGNLTHPGLLRAGPAGGNLEAGVVLAPEALFWDDPGSAAGVSVQRVLPIAWDAATELHSDALRAGDGMPERPPAYVPPPIPYLRWQAAPDGSGRLAPPVSGAAAHTVLDADGNACARDAIGALWPGPCPPEVRITWGEATERLTQSVPVIDVHGRVAGTALAPVALDEVWAMLADFPLPPADDVDELDDSDAGPDRAGPAGTSVPGIGGAPAGRYAIRRVMELVERVADRQTAVQAVDWTAWCTRLGQVLEQAKDDPEITAFRGLNLNPLSPLRAGPFRPDFARDRGTPAGQIYEDTLDRVEAAWQVAALEPLEA